MTTPVFDPAESHTGAWVDDLAALVKAATGAEAWELDEIPADAATRLSRWVEVHLESRETDGLARSGGQRTDRGYRLSLRVVVKSIDDGRLIQDRLRRLFRAPVALGGESTLVRHEPGGRTFARDDEGYYTALTDFVFVR